MNKAPIETLRHSRNRSGWMGQLTLGLLLTGLVACSRGQLPGAGPQKRMKLKVGEISEVSLARPADSLVRLTGSSDNSEVVDVSPKEDAATQASPTTSSASGQRVFLIKGVTLGTARVVFSEKRTGEAGDGQVRKTYLVQVVSK